MIDLVVGKQGTKPAVLTLVESKTRKSLYVLIRNKTQKEVIRAIRRARRLVGGDFSEVFKTIKADNGSEFLDSEAIKKAANAMKFITPTLTAAGKEASMKTGIEY